jgi:hypothetical protein
MNYITKDLGKKRTKFKTGATREIVAGKGRYDLISPIAMRRLSKIYENGAIKYEARGWEKGLPFHSLLDSAKRHLNQFQEGYTDEDHLGQCLWNVAALIHEQEMIERGLLPKELNDLPDYTK